jgi:predicted small lipoprotein YifL
MKKRHPPCPFCAEVRWRFVRDPGTCATQVECAHCGARGPLRIPDEDEALAASSERTTVPEAARR